jgi:hypothetical protein
MFPPVLNGEQLIGNMESDCGSVEDNHAEDNEDGSNDSDGSDEVESSSSVGARTGRHSKQRQDPSACQSKTAASSARNPKRTRTEMPEPAEKTANQL